MQEQRHSCPFEGRSREDVLREISDLVEEHIRGRDITRTEIDSLSDIFADVAEAEVAKHAYSCPFSQELRTLDSKMASHITAMDARERAAIRAEETSRNKASTHANVAKFIGEIIIAVIALVGLALGIDSRFSDPGLQEIMAARGEEHEALLEEARQQRQVFTAILEELKSEEN